MRGKTSRKIIGLGIITCVAIIGMALIGTVIAEDEEPHGPFHFIQGYVYYNNTNVPAAFASLCIYNVTNGTWWNISTNEIGWYHTNLGSFEGPGWAAGDPFVIYAYGNSSLCWTNWSGNVSGTVPLYTAWYNITMETTLDPYDVGTEAINYPADGDYLCPDPISYVINATVKNYGATYTHSFPVELRIYDSLGNLVFSDVENVNNLLPGEERYVEFDAWTPPDMTEDYTIVVTTNMTCPNHDYMPWTDSKSITVHVLQRIIDMEVEKKVWNESSLTWDDKVTIPTVPYTVTFNISIHNNGTCNTLTNITVVDTLTAGLQYVPGSTTINGVAGADPEIVGSTLIWNASKLGYVWPNALEPCQWIYIEFEANVTEYGTDVNNASASAEAWPTWEAATGEDAPGAYVISDSTPPVTVISYGDPHYIDSYIYITSATPIYLEATDDITGVAYTVYWIDGGAPVTVYDNGVGDEDATVGVIKTTFYITGDDGVHTVYFYSVDNAGNVETSKSQEFYLDNTPPDISIIVDGPQYNSYVTSDTMFSFEVSDTGSGTRETIFEEYFDGVTPPDLPPGWTQYNEDGGDDFWQTGTYVYDPHSPPYYAYCKWDIPNDDWLVTPMISLIGYSNCQLTFWYHGNSFFTCDFDLMISTTGNTPADFVLLKEYRLPAGSNYWQSDVVDLSAYDGQNIWLAWRYISNNQFSCNIDDIVITGEKTLPPIEYRIWWNDTWTPWMDYVGPFNLTQECKHIIQARAEDNLGNEGIENFTFYVDNTGPTVKKIISGPGWANYTWITSDTMFEFEATDPEGGRYYELVKDVLLQEDFSGGVPPAGWTDTHAAWQSSYSNYAGGTAPEAKLSWLYAVDGCMLYTYGIDTTGYTDLTLQFKTYVDDYYGAAYPYTLHVQTSTNGIDWTDVWTLSPTDDYGPETVEISLSDKIGFDTLYIAFTFTGDYYGINYWYIDDVILEGEYGAELPCASGVAAIYYRVWYMGNWSDWILYEEPFHLENNCTHMIEFYAVDNLGNEGEHTIQTHYLDETPADSWLVIDLGVWERYITTYTEFTIFASTDGCNGTTAPYRIYFSISGPEGSKFYWQGEYYPCDGTWQIGINNTPIAFQIRDENGFAPSGLYRVKFYAVNLLTGKMGPQHEETFKIDIDPPEVEMLFEGPYYISMDKEYVYVSPSTAIKLEADDGKDYATSGVKTIKYKVDDGEWQTYMGDKIMFTVPGIHTLSYYAKDKLENSGDVVTKTIIVDATAPNTNIGFDGEMLEKDNAVVITPNTKIVLTSSDDCGVKEIYYIIDGNTMKYSSPFTLPAGEHVIEYYAEDNLGNVETARYSTVVVDDVAPSIVVEKPRTSYLYIAGREILPIPRTAQIDVVVIGPLDVKVTCIDESKVNKIELYIDGKKEFEVDGDALEWQWDKFALFTHTIEIKAYDYFGHSSSVKIKALVFNL